MQIIDFILCEDIRFEEGGKRSLMGVFEDTITIVEHNNQNNWPKPLSFGLMLRALLSEEQVAKKPSDFELFLQLDAERAPLAKGKISPPPVGSPSIQRLAIAILVKNFPLNKTEKIWAILQLKDKDGKILAEQKTADSIKLKVRVINQQTPTES
jgi:hypothetical protein